MEPWLKGALIGGIVGGIGGGLVALLVAVFTPRRNCPECGFAFPKMGTKYRRKGLAGGWICPDCKCEVDRHGKAVT